MVFSSALIDVGIALLLSVALAEWAKVRKKTEKGFNWLASAGVLFLFAGIIDASTLPGLYNLVSGLYLDTLFAGVGALFALLGSLFIVYETVLEK